MFELESSCMARSADVVIIGAGIVGSSIAFHLTEAGCKNVLVIERETRQGLGSTGKSMGGVRAQFATDVNIRMSLYSIPFLARFEEATGHPSGYKPHGYLFMATNDWHMNYLRTNSARQKKLGLKNVELLAPDDIRKILPQLRSDDIVGGSLCSTDGFVDPDSVMTGFMARAIERGAELWRGTEVTGIYTDHDTVSGVLTTKGGVSAPVVVNAAGPWAAGVARMAGADLPVQPLRRMLVPTEPFPGLPERLPMMIDMSTGWHFRQEGLGLLMAWAHPDEQPGFRTDFDPALHRKESHACRLPRTGLRQPGGQSQALLGGDVRNVPGPSRHSRALARSPRILLRQRLQRPRRDAFSRHGPHSRGLDPHGETSVIDAQDLNVQRFAEGRAIEETAIL